MKKKNLAIGLLIMLLVSQFANATGFYSKVNADAIGTQITENIIQSVTMAVYENGTQVTDNVYKLDSTVKLNLTYLLPDDTDVDQYVEGANYTYTLPSQLKIDQSYSGILVFDEFPDGIGTYTVGTDNKVLFTFNKNIEGLMNRGGTFWIESTLSSTKITGSTEQILAFPIAGNAGNSITLNIQPNNGTAIRKDGTLLPQTYNPQSMEWTVDVNTSLDHITDALVTDIIPAGLELDVDSISVYGLNVDVQGNVTQGGPVSPGLYDTDGSDLTRLNLKFNNAINEAYRVKFSTRIINTDTARFTNTATLTGNGISQDASQSLDIVRGKPLDKSQKGYDAATESITWEIKYNYNEKAIAADDAVLADYFNKSQEFVAGSMTVYAVTLDQNGNGTDGAALIGGTDYTVTPLPVKDDKVGFELQFNNDIQSAYRIVYKTKVADRLYTNEQIRNDVTYSTYGDGDQLTITQRILNKQVVDNATDVDYASKTVNWTVKVNEDSRAMTNLILTDIFGNAGLQLIGKPVITPSPGVEGVDYEIIDLGTGDFSKGDGFKINFLKPINQPYTITYTTKFDYYQLSAGANIFANTASITWDEKAAGTPAQTSTRTFTPRDEVKNNGLKTGSYDTASKQITWTVGANYNKRVLSAGAELVDTLPAGQKVDTSSVTVYQLDYAANGNPYTVSPALIKDTDYTITVTDTELKVKLKNAVNYAFYVVFKTEFIGEDINQTTVTNTAILNDAQNNPVSELLVGNANVPKGGEYIAKDGARDNTDQTLMNWTVTINANQSTVSKVEVLDTPSSNQVLLPASFQVIEAAVAANGNVSETATTLVRDIDYTLEFITDKDGQDSFKLVFTNTIDKAYILKYQSVVTAVGQVVLSNAVSFSGEGSKKIMKDINSEKTVQIVETGGTGSGIKGLLKVLKTNADGSVNLAGAAFSLERIVGTQLMDKQDGITDSNGGLEFKDLRAGKYILKETKAPDGYTLDTTEHQVTINSATPVLMTITNGFNGSLKLTKVAQEDPAKRLEGAEFELYDSANILVKSGTTDENGELIFTNLKGGNYTLKEKTAPAGYVLSTKAIAVTIDPAQENVLAPVTNELLPQEVLGSLKLTKVDQDNPTKKLAGAEFKLYDSSRNLVATGTTDINGELEFKELKPGAYTLEESAAPNGYELDATEHNITIDSAVQKVLPAITNKVKAEPTPTPTATPTETPTEAPTTAPTEAPTATPTPIPTDSSTTVPGSVPSPSASTIPGVVVTATPAPTVTPAVTATPTAIPTATPVIPSTPPAASSTPPVPQVTQATTIEDIPIVGEIPLGGIPSIGKEPAHGTAVVTPEGKWTYTPDPGYIGEDEFTIVITDEEGNEEEIIIEIDVDEVPTGTVTGTNDNGLPGKLPQTGESSPIPLYVTGCGLIVLGAILARRFKTRSK